MATTAELRRAVLRAESELDRQDRALRGVQDLAAAIQAELAKMTESERQLLTGLYYADQLNQLTNPNFGRLLALTAARDAAAAALDAIRAELAAAVAAEPPIWSGGDPTPAVLMPTRLEVRYLSGASGPELAIRVVPDDIGVHSFEPELTAEEVAEGTSYWTAVTAGNVDDEVRSAAWVKILGRLGAARAAWTVETMRPIGPPMAGGPQLPDVPTKESAWTRAANCLVLPDRFTFRGWRGGQLVFEVTGKDVPDDLTLGPDPTALQGARPDLPDGQPALAWSGSSSWMIDFEDAVEVGLGVRIPLAGTDLSFDEIFAVGISDRSPADAQARLATTLRGHLYTSGLAFPTPDAPTNNTAATRSDWTTAPTMRTPEEVEDALAAARPGADQPGVRVADAIGLPDSVSRDPGRRDVLVAAGATVDDHEALTRRAHELLMAYNKGFAGLGDFGATLDVGWVTTPALRQHFVELVRSRGPLATVRIGRQPYGLLPATSLTLWGADGADVPSEATDLLRLLRAAIARQLPASPRIGRDRDQDAVLVDLLQRLPESVAVREGKMDQRKIDRPGAHPIAGARPLLDWSDFLRCTFAPDGSASLLDPALSGMLDVAAGALANAKVAAAAWSTGQPELDFSAQLGPLFEFLGPLGEVTGTEAGVFWSLALPIAFWGAYLGCAAIKAHREAEVAGNAAEAQKMGQAVTDFDALFAALRALLADVLVDQGAVDRAIGRAVEALTSRVDAWVTSLASARLRTVQEAAVGVRLGAYGWVVDVRPTPPELRKAEAGWVLTPSLQHAATTAVLHSGWSAHSDPEAFAVDLTSRRVRRAMATLAAIRDGRTLEELLGYQLERDLHDAELDRFVAAFRRDFPLAPVVTTDADPAATTEARQAQGARLVADGEAVRRAAPELAAAAVGTLQGATPDELATARAILAGLEETVDSMGDLLLAEGVHQLVGGSPLRAGLAADTVGRAAPVPDRLDVVRTPRRTVSVNHAVGLAVVPGGGPWPSTPRAELDPVAEAVAGWALGAPEDWTVELTPADGSPTQTSTLATLDVAAIDVVVECDLSSVTQLDRRVIARAGRRVRSRCVAPTGSAGTAHCPPSHRSPAGCSPPRARRHRRAPWSIRSDRLAWPATSVRWRPASATGGRRCRRP